MTEYKKSILEEKLEDAEAELADARSEIQRLNALAAVHYLSTACWHEVNDGNPEMHASCRATCKWCSQVCSCPNHPAEDTVSAPPHWVDQARDVARELTDVLGGWKALTGLPGDLGERAANDPALFWLRGEEAPPGEWQPPTQGDH